MPNITITTPAVNEILVSSSYLINLGQTNRLGPSQIEHTSTTNALIGDIFFKFYRCVDVGGIKTYSALDISSAIADSAVESRFLTMLFTQYYGDSSTVSEIGGSFPDLAERLSGVESPTTNLAATLTMPSQSSSYLEFVGMGLSSWVGANYINGESSGRSSALWGTRAGQVHITGLDPLDSSISKVYDNSDSGCWQFDSTFNCDGIIVYTNMMGGAFTNPGLSVWSQILCVWPILASTLNADYACIFSTLDQSFMRSGLGFIDRQERQDTYFGWSGNYLQSIFNDWGIPVISPIWCMSYIALAAYVTYGTLGSSATNNLGSLTAATKGWRFVGPTASNNISAISEKTARCILPILWANECHRGNTDVAASAIPSLESTIASLGYSSVSNYLSTCLTGTSEGYNAHIYKYILDEAFGTYTPSSTRSYINTTSISWSSKLSSQPSLAGCFVNSANSRPKYFPAALEDYYTVAPLTYGEALQNRIEDNSIVSVDPNSSAQSLAIRNWLYTP